MRARRKYFKYETPIAARGGADADAFLCSPYRRIN